MKKYNKIVILDSVILYPEHRYRLDLLSDNIVEYNTCSSEEEVLERVKGADCIISCWVDISNRVIDENPQLKTIAFWTHAYEHRIDKKYAESKGIFVPCIPDYGTDSVAELAFIGMMNSATRINGERRNKDEEIALQIANSVRNFQSNVKDNLTGHWVHEYVKTGKLKITDPGYFSEDTLKGLTVGLLVDRNSISNELISILSCGFKMNLIHCCYDIPYSLNVSFRPFEQLITESQVLIYDSRIISKENQESIFRQSYIEIIDISKIVEEGSSIRGRKLGIVGLGRIGTRVAQIATQGYGMEVCYYSRTPKKEVEDSLGINYLPLEQLLSTSDIISFHLPHVGAEGFVTDDMIELIPKGTMVINVSVGNIFSNQDYLFNRFCSDDLVGYVDVYATMPPRALLREKREYLLSTYRLGWRTKSTIGLKTHKLITKLELGIDKL